MRGVEISAAQREALVARGLRAGRRGSKKRAAKAHAVRLAYQAEGRDLATRADAAFVAGCMLFWAEGSRSRNSVKFTNSDPEMMAFFMRFLRRYFGVTDDMVSVWCNLFADHAERQHEVEQFWLDKLELPRTSLGRSTVNVYSKHSKRLRTNVLPYGTCRISVHRTRVVQMIYGAIQELGGFEREQWAA